MNKQFGDATRHTGQQVLNGLIALGVAQSVIVTLSPSTVKINQNGKTFAGYKYFEGIDQPLFRFRGDAYKNLKNLKGEHALVLSVHGTPGIVLNGPVDASPEVWTTVHRCLTNDTRDPFYALHQNAGAFFQGGSNDRDGGYIYIEFWKPAGAQAWLDAFNAELKKPKNGLGTILV